MLAPMQTRALHSVMRRAFPDALYQIMSSNEPRMPYLRNPDRIYRRSDHQGEVYQS